LSAVAGDFYIYCGMKFIADSISDWSRAPSFFYYFSHTPSQWDYSFLGVTHEAELAYVFNANLFGNQFTFEEFNLSLAMVNYWTNFHIYGDPNGLNSTWNWPAYTLPDRQVLFLDLEMSVDTIPIDGYCSYLWDPILQGILPNITTTNNSTGNFTTNNPTTGNATTWNSTTGDPTTGNPTTANPTTANPTTNNPSTGTTANPSTGTTQNPTTGSTQNPTTGSTQNPTTGSTQNPTTGTSSNPTTQGTISNPTTQDPTTGVKNPTTEDTTASIVNGGSRLTLCVSAVWLVIFFVLLM